MLQKILDSADGFNRVDMVSSKYFKQNLDFRVRKNFGKGSNTNKKDEKSSLFPKNVQKHFLLNNDNMEDINSFLTDYILCSYDRRKTLVKPLMIV